FNARHFAATLREELTRAMRFDRPMSLVMADLDLLRDINNTYGHLAGDAVLAGVAKIFREQLREYDVPARFGGEEFSILLPETRAPRLLSLPEDGEEPMRQLAPVPDTAPPIDRRSTSRPHAHSGPRFLWVGGRLAIFVGLVGILGTGTGLFMSIVGGDVDVL